MGRVPGVPAEAGQWLYGESEMPGVHRTAIQGVGLHNRVRHGPGLRSHSEGYHAVHDVTTEER